MAILQTRLLDGFNDRPIGIGNLRIPKDYEYCKGQSEPLVLPLTVVSQESSATVGTIS